jgi:serine/threonine-protein kinase
LQGAVHCDLKPSNILIADAGRVLVTDFGLVHMLEGATNTTLVGGGTPAYMAPEQVRGDDPTKQTDVYALGVILFEMLTGGERPFAGEDSQATGSVRNKVMWEHVNQPAPSPRVYNPKLSAQLAAVVTRCLQKDPAERFPSALDLLLALENAIDRSASIAPMSPVAMSPTAIEPAPAPASKPIGLHDSTTARSVAKNRRRWIVIGTLTALAAIGGGAILITGPIGQRLPAGALVGPPTMTDEPDQVVVTSTVMETATATLTATSTATPTSTATSTSTRTPTSTATTTSTATETRTPTRRPTRRPTATPTATSTALPNATETATPEPTEKPAHPPTEPPPTSTRAVPG